MFVGSSRQVIVALSTKRIENNASWLSEHFLWIVKVMAVKTAVHAAQGSEGIILEESSDEDISSDSISGGS